MNRRALLPAILAVGAVYLVSTVIALVVVPVHPQLGIAVAFDLTITAAAWFWLLAVRPGHAKPAALFRVLVLGFAMARLLVGIRALGIAGIMVELAVTAFLVVRARRIVRRVRALRREGHGLHAALEAAFAAAMPSRVLASVIASEVATVSFALTGWFRSPPVGFAMHRRSGYLLVLSVICVLAVIEGVGMHVILVRVAPTVAIVLSALSAYSLLWLCGVAHATRLSPLRFTDVALVIERGITRRAFVRFADITHAVPTAATSADAVDLSYVEPNVELELRAPVEVHGMFGRSRHATKLTLSVDDRDAFFAQLAERVDRRIVDSAAK
ncbi:MAG TPA: hypothetical protein VIV40_30125 [Kofleriaceae bacterium]